MSKHSPWRGSKPVQRVQRSTTVASADMDIERGIGAIAHGIIVTLRDCSSEERRRFRRMIAGRNLSEKCVDTVRRPDGKTLPRCLLISGPKPLLDAIRQWLYSADNDIIVEWQNVIDAPRFVRGKGSSELSEKARRFSALNREQKRADMSSKQIETVSQQWLESR